MSLGLEGIFIGQRNYAKLLTVGFIFSSPTLSAFRFLPIYIFNLLPHWIFVNSCSLLQTLLCHFRHFSVLQTFTTLLVCSFLAVFKGYLQELYMVFAFTISGFHFTILLFGILLLYYVSHISYPSTVVLSPDSIRRMPCRKGVGSSRWIFGKAAFPAFPVGTIVNSWQGSIEGRKVVFQVLVATHIFDINSYTSQFNYYDLELGHTDVFSWSTQPITWNHPVFQKIYFGLIC